MLTRQDVFNHYDSSCIQPAVEDPFACPGGIEPGQWEWHLRAAAGVIHHMRGDCRLGAILDDMSPTAREVLLTNLTHVVHAAHERYAVACRPSSADEAGETT